MSDESSKTNPSPQHQGASEVVVGTAVDPLVGREVGGYVIEAALGEGGMGLVYQARHPFLGRRFAVKVLRPELAADQQQSSNFVREAQTLSGLKHPHIVDIVGFGPLDGQRQYMVMEFLEGRTLEAELEEHGALPVHRVLSLAEEILDGLEAAHSIDVIHRDLKPSNVFLAKVSGGNTVVKLLDFGLAKLQPQALAGDAGAPSAKSTIAGTPDYIAPEQALGKGVSKLSDLYSFGVILYEVLTGTKLFTARYMSLDPIHDLIDHHLYSEPPKLGEAFPEELERLVSELLEKDPKKRPQSVALVRQRIRRLTKDLQREQTRQGPNPLERTAEIARVPDVDVQKLVPSRKGPVVVVAVLAVLAPLLWWASSRPAEVVPPVIVVAPAPAPVPAPVAPAPVRAEVDELAPLSEIARAEKVSPPQPSPRPSPAGRGSTSAPAPAPIECEANDKWRTAARAHMQELQQLAANKGSAAAWDRFEDAEGALTNAISTASSGAECAAVEKRIQQLARELSR
jgi:serine/threonine-protein kinase